MSKEAVNVREKCSDFEYEALPNPSEWMRLIHIPQRRDKNRISCELIAVSRSEASKYRALSYTWGSGPAQHKVLLNGQRFWVTDNLYDFLRIHTKGERSEDRELLWIDAICINQQDAIEKSQQVQIMGVIYKSADSVIVWLCKSHDPLSKEYENAIAFMKYADRHSGEPGIAAKFLELFGNDEVHFLSILNALFRHPYWSRVWIVQEVILAKQI